MPYISPALWALLQRHANGDADVPATTAAYLTYSSEHETAVQQAIATTSIKQTDTEPLQFPTDQLLPLIQMPEINGGGLIDETGLIKPSAPRAAMNDTLTDAVTAYDNGVPASAAVQYAFFVDTVKHRMFISIEPANGTDDANVRNWLQERQIYAAPSDHHITGGYLVLTILSLPDVVTLAEAYPTISMKADDIKGQGAPLNRKHWPQELRDYENSLIDSIRTIEAPPPPTDATGVQ